MSCFSWLERLPSSLRLPRPCGHAIHSCFQFHVVTFCGGIPTPQRWKNIPFVFQSPATREPVPHIITPEFCHVQISVVNPRLPSPRPSDCRTDFVISWLRSQRDADSYPFVAPALGLHLFFAAMI